jgi:periplasmic divalent cation tolerance protein
MDIIAVLTTTASLEQARAIADALVERGLAACVQISSIESFYTWEGATQNDREYRLLIKTTGERYADVQSAILELHSYELPAIVAVELSHAYSPYAEWVAGSVE